MKQVGIALTLGVLISSSCYAADPYIEMSTNPDQALLGETVNFQCAQGGDWRSSLRSARIDIADSQGATVVSRARMEVNGTTASYDFIIPSAEQIGNWNYKCALRDRRNRVSQTDEFLVVASTPTDPTPTNNSPVAVDDSVATPFDTLVTIDVLSNDSDVDGNLLASSLTITSGPTGGTAVRTANDAVMYTPATGYSGGASFMYEICDTAGLCDQATVSVTVAEPELPVDPLVDATIPAHKDITNYNGPATCIECHKVEAAEMLQSLHMQWSGPTPKLSNTEGESFGKAKGGINTFCTYAMSSKSACFFCHVRADGNDPAPVEPTDVDCLMCHNDTYQRTFVTDSTNTVEIVYEPDRIRPPDEAVTVQPDGTITKKYVFGKVETDGNYTTEPDFSKMPEGTNMVNLARTVHMPTNTSCLRCHAKAGGGDWTKRGDMGLNSANATVEQDVHLAKEQDGGAELSCVDCHSALNHKIAGRGIDLRQTEAAAPTCQSCHNEAPHSNATLNRHAQGQVSCQVCHIREYAKGGATEMSRDWNNPVWNPAFCSGQGGFVGHEVKEANVKPEYVWFDGTSYVYNVGETIEADENNILHMAKANGRPFDGNSSIVPIKRHFSNIPLDASGKIIPPAIMWMFMTGNFDIAVQKGIEEQEAMGRVYDGAYEMKQADAEMLITHGVEPKENAPSCIECHDGSGSTSNGMLPFDELGYHQFPASVKSCNLCHESKSLSWESTHSTHRQEVSCSSCHTPEPTGVKQGVCNDCHENKSWRSDEGHKKHFIEKNVDCIRCHTFS